MNNFGILIAVFVGVFIIPFCIFIISVVITIIKSKGYFNNNNFDKDIILGKLSNSDVSLNQVLDNLKITNSLFDENKSNSFKHVGK